MISRQRDISLTELVPPKGYTITGTRSHGQEHAQLVTGQPGVPFEDIEVIHGDTAKTLFVRFPFPGSRRCRQGL